MIEILHTIGLCPDHMSHPSIITALMADSPMLHSILHQIKRYASKLRPNRAVSTNK